MLQISKGKSKKQSDKSVDGAVQTTDGLPDSVQSPAGNASHESSSGEPMQSSAREEQIALIAYYKAQQRGLQEDRRLEDWLAAEREFDSAYLARTMGQQGDEP